jgi:hypothetical protein
MRTILVGDFAAYILERGKAEAPSQYETFKGIIESVRCGGIKVPMEFDTFGRLHFQDDGSVVTRTVHLNGSSDIEGRWDITENLVTLRGSFPKSLIQTQRTQMADGGLLLGNAVDIPFHRDRTVYSLVHEDDRVSYHLDNRDGRRKWEDVLEILEGPAAVTPGILDRMD